MKKIFILLACTLGYFMQSQAQTKLIAHKSHSGSLAHFKVALEADLFDMGTSDFGDPGWSEEKHRLDSLVKIDDTTIIMYVTHFCKWGYSDEDSLRVCDNYNRRMSGTDFSKAIYEEEVLELLEQNTQFDYPVKDTKLIGYSKKVEADVKEIPANNLSLEIPVTEEKKNEKLQQKPTKKQLRKEKRALKKAEKQAKKGGTVKEEEKPKTCTKPKIEIPVFLDDSDTTSNEPILTESKRYEWLVMAGLTLFSILIGVFAQFLRRT